MKNTLADDLADLIKKHSVTTEELINAITSKNEENPFKKCGTCGSKEEKKIDFPNQTTLRYCRVCSKGTAVKNIIIRAKKTTKSLSLPLIDRGHTIRYYNKDNTQDLIHFSLYFPRDIELRSKDDVTIEIPFFTSEDSLIKEISRRGNGIEILKTLDSIQKLESKIVNTYKITNFYEFQFQEEYLVDLTWEAENLKRDLINKLEDNLISDKKEKSALKKTIKDLCDFESKIKSLRQLINGDSDALSLAITLFKNKIKKSTQNEIIFEVSASKIINNTTKRNYTLNSTDICKSNILELCNNFINSTVLSQKD